LIPLCLEALKLDRKYGTARVAMSLLYKKWDFLFDPEELEIIDKYDVDNTRNSDQENFQKNIKICENRWIEFCKEKPVEKVPEKLEEPVVIRISPESYDFGGIGDCFIDLLETENFEKTKISITHLIGKKRKLRAIKNIEIQPVLPKRRKKTEKVEKANSKKERRKELVLEHNSAFSLIMPYVLLTEIKSEFNDCLGSALNESAIVSEQLGMKITV
jgi:hypothetical protein